MAMIERNRAKPGVVIGQSVSNHSIRAATGIDHSAGAVSAQSWFPDDLHPSRHSVVDGYAAVTRGQSVPVRATCAHPTQSKQRRATMKRSTPFLALGLWVAALGFAAAVQAGEIGRASGRERVCQYV